jgi:hypothetical protein
LRRGSLDVFGRRHIRSRYRHVLGRKLHMLLERLHELRQQGADGQELSPFALAGRAQTAEVARLDGQWPAIWAREKPGGHAEDECDGG